MDQPRHPSDDFWKIAFYDGENILESDVKAPSEIAASVYDLPISPYGWIRCELSPLEVTDGSPLGAKAWYGSALMSALLLQSNENNKLRQQIREHCCHGRFTVLELGSGAVGLAGLVAGFSVMGYLRSILPESLPCRVFLTDHEPYILQQLVQNVRSNEAHWAERFSRSDMPEFLVLNLDWKDGLRGTNTEGRIELVIGSELIYNTDTAKACAKIVLQLLQDYPTVLLVLVQVTHRDGWKDIFLPTVRQTPGICIEEETLSIGLHEVASKLVSPGGTLNPLADFTVCFIYRDKSSSV